MRFTRCKRQDCCASPSIHVQSAIYLRLCPSLERPEALRAVPLDATTRRHDGTAGSDAHPLSRPCRPRMTSRRQQQQLKKESVSSCGELPATDSEGNRLPRLQRRQHVAVLLVRELGLLLHAGEVKRVHLG